MKSVSGVKLHVMKPEYNREDLGTGTREAYQARHNVVLLKPEVAKAFPTEEAVNDGLLSLIQVARKSVGRSER